MNKILIRFFDFTLSLIGLILLLPVFIIVAVFIALDSGGGVFFRQSRVGKGTQFTVRLPLTQPVAQAG